MIVVCEVLGVLPVDEDDLGVVVDGLTLFDEYPLLDGLEGLTLLDDNPLELDELDELDEGLTLFDEKPELLELCVPVELLAVLRANAISAPMLTLNDIMINTDNIIVASFLLQVLIIIPPLNVQTEIALLAISVCFCLLLFVSVCYCLFDPIFLKFIV